LTYPSYNPRFLIFSQAKGHKTKAEVIKIMAAINMDCMRYYMALFGDYVNTISLKSF